MYYIIVILSRVGRGGGREGHVLILSRGGGGGEGEGTQNPVIHCLGRLELGIWRTPGPRMFGQFFEGRVIPFTSLTTLSCKRMHVQYTY